VSQPAEATTLSIRDATPADAASLSEFASWIFHESFAWGNDVGDMAAYMADAFTAERQRAEIEEPGAVTLLVEHAGALVGFAPLRRGAAPSCVQGAAPVELKRFYVATSWHGRGVAQSLMSAVLERARGAGGDSIWLGVWAPNARAIAFYRKAGFEEVGTHVFQLGTDAQTDLVMRRRL